MNNQSDSLIVADYVVVGTGSAGARLVTGGTYDGLFSRPTVLTNVGPETPAYANEIFGPVAVVRSFATDDEAVAMACDSEYALTLGILPLVGIG